MNRVKAPMAREDQHHYISFALLLTWQSYSRYLAAFIDASCLEKTWHKREVLCLDCADCILIDGPMMEG